MGLRGQIFAFLTVGSCAAVVHYGVLIGLHEYANADPVVGSAAGFVLGGLLNYALNYRFTFRSRRAHRAALPRFVAVAALGLLLNSALMEGLVHHLGVHYLAAQVATTAVLILWHFGINRVWTFADPPGSPGNARKEGSAGSRGV